MAWQEIVIPSDREAADFVAQHKKKARFLVDECLGETVVLVLQGAGWNTKGVWEFGLVGRDDKEIMACAWNERRVLLTHDDDFLDNREFPEHRNPGVIVLPGADGGDSILLKALGQAVSLVGHFPEIYQGSWMRICQDGVFIVRSRDKQTGKISTERYMFSKHGAPLVEKIDRPKK